MPSINFPTDALPTRAQAKNLAQMMRRQAMGDPDATADEHIIANVLELYAQSPAVPAHWATAGECIAMSVTLRRLHQLLRPIEGHALIRACNVLDAFAQGKLQPFGVQQPEAQSPGKR